MASLTDARLDLLYEAEGFGGENTMRARVIRELIDEVRALRRHARLAAPAALDARDGSPIGRASSAGDD